MRIVHIVEAAGGGTGRHVHDLARGLIRRGHDISIVYSPVRIEPSFEQGLSDLEGKARLYTVPFQREIGLHDFSHLRELTRLLKSEGPFDVIHGHSSKAGAMVRLLPRSIPGARIYTPHAVRTMDPTLSGFGRRFYGTIERFLSLRPGHFVAGSRHEVKSLHRIGVRDDRIELLQFGIDRDQGTTREQARQENGLPADAKILGFVGRLNWQKAPERAIRALKALDDQSIKLAIVGTGQMDQEVRDLARQLGFEDRVLFLGFRNGERIMPAFDALVMPSRYESSPYVLLEAIMAGIPIITTPIGMAEQLIHRGTSGQLVANSDDPALWAEAIQRQLGPETADTSVSSMSDLQRLCSLDSMIESMEVFYARTCANTESKHV